MYLSNNQKNTRIGRKLKGDDHNEMHGKHRAMISYRGIYLYGNNPCCTETLLYQMLGILWHGTCQMKIVLFLKTPTAGKTLRNASLLSTKSKITGGFGNKDGNLQYTNSSGVSGDKKVAMK